MHVLLLLEKNGWKQAEIAFQNLYGKDKPIFLTIKQKILRAKSEDMSIPVMERKTIEMELKELTTVDKNSFEQVLL